MPRLLAAAAALVTARAAEPPFALVSRAAVTGGAALREASGLAASRRDDRFLWSANDSGGTPDLHLLETTGAYRGKLAVLRVKNTDWEDLASFTLDGRSYLLIADTGDNEAKRETCSLLIVREPELPAAGKSLDARARTAWEIRFRYEDGPRDCESVAVDAAAGTILLLSKRDAKPALYQLPLRPSGIRPVHTARRIGATSITTPSDSLIPFRDQPTGMDISPDRSHAAVVTYYGVFLYPRNAADSWADAFARPPVALAPHRAGQVESVAFSPDGRSLHVIPEGKSPKLIRYQKQAPPDIRRDAPPAARPAEKTSPIQQPAPNSDS